MNKGSLAGRVLWGISLLLAGAVAHADARADDPNQFLLNAITVCPAEANPLSLLQVTGGNSFFEPVFSSENENQITVKVMINLQLYNPMLRTPVKQVGTMRVQMDYPAPHYVLQCHVEMMGEKDGEPGGSCPRK